MDNIILIGFMGSGKTTIGKELGVNLGVPVIDTDDLIIQREGRSINQMFAEDGEEYFRLVESEVIKQIPKKNTVITTGGGVIINKENRCVLQRKGTVIFLKCEPQEIFKRLKKDQSRPLLAQNKQVQIQELYKKRYPLYEETSNWIIDTTNISINEIVQSILAYIRRV